MSLDKAIASGREHRKPYHRGGRFDRSCRPGGSCPYCKRSRTLSEQRNAARAKDEGIRARKR